MLPLMPLCCNMSDDHQGRQDMSGGPLEVAVVRNFERQANTVLMLAGDPTQPAQVRQSVCALPFVMLLQVGDVCINDYGLLCRPPRLPRAKLCMLTRVSIHVLAAMALARGQSSMETQMKRAWNRPPGWPLRKGWSLMNDGSAISPDGQVYETVPVGIGHEII